MGLTKSIRDEYNWTDEATPKTSSKCIHVTDENSRTNQCLGQLQNQLYRPLRVQ